MLLYNPAGRIRTSRGNEGGRRRWLRAFGEDCVRPPTTERINTNGISDTEAWIPCIGRLQQGNALRVSPREFLVHSGPIVRHAVRVGGNSPTKLEQACMGNGIRRICHFQQRPARGMEENAMSL